MRVCSRKGCQKDLLKPDGLTPDYSKRRWCGPECRKLDLRDKMRAMRAESQKAHQGIGVRRNKARTDTLAAVEGDLVAMWPWKRAERRSIVFTANWPANQQVVGVILYDHERDKLIFKATESAGADLLVALLRKQLPDLDFAIRPDQEMG